MLLWPWTVPLSRRWGLGTVGHCAPFNSSSGQRRRIPIYDNRNNSAFARSSVSSLRSLAAGTIRGIYFVATAVRIVVVLVADRSLQVGAGGVGPGEAVEAVFLQSGFVLAGDGDVPLADVGRLVADPAQQTAVGRIRRVQPVLRGGRAGR